jgi:hypothetical protein
MFAPNADQEKIDRDNVPIALYRNRPGELLNVSVDQNDAMPTCMRVGHRGKVRQRRPDDFGPV